MTQLGRTAIDTRREREWGDWSNEQKEDLTMTESQPWGRAEEGEVLAMSVMQILMQ